MIPAQIWHQNPSNPFSRQQFHALDALMADIEVGRKAPDFALTTDASQTFRLSEHRGRPVVLFFYPENDTEGCTVENLEFSEHMPEFDRLGVSVVGISPDTVEKHCRFRDKYGLRATLAADPDRKVIRAYAIWGRKKLFGHEYDGVIRTTFLIGPDGKIARIWPVTRIRGMPRQCSVRRARW
jgi:thioredoxin-dependent peroxiredoxin